MLTTAVPSQAVLPAGGEGAAERSAGDHGGGRHLLGHLQLLGGGQPAPHLLQQRQGAADAEPDPLGPAESTGGGEGPAHRPDHILTVAQLTSSHPHCYPDHILRVTLLTSSHPHGMTVNQIISSLLTRSHPYC